MKRHTFSFFSSCCAQHKISTLSSKTHTKLKAKRASFINAALLLSLTTLTACGGGSDDGGESNLTPSDTLAPVITLNGDSTLTHSAGFEYADPGAIANDATDGSVEVTMTGSVDITVINSYTITYTATDAAGNKSSLTRVVKVIDDIAPTLNIIGANPVTLNAGDIYTDEGATANDNVEQVVTINTSGEVDTAAIGSYTINYTAQDAAGNKSSVDRTVNVADLTGPMITLNGAETIDHHLGKPYTDLGAIAVDVVDGNVAVTIEGEVKINVLGEYVLTYSASDNALNTSSVTRTVSVIKPADNIAPQVNITFPPQNSLTQGKSLVVRGNASDEGDGVKSVSVNGVEATTTDNFASWSATIPLEIGVNSLDVLVTDIAENTNTPQVSSKIKSQPIFLNSPKAMALDSSNNRALVLEGSRYDVGGYSLVTVDLATSKITIISDSNTPGVDIALKLYGELTLDSVNNRVLVFGSQNIVAVDLNNGLRTIFTGDNIPNANNPFASNNGGLAIDKGNNLVVVSSGTSSTAKILAVDLATGNRTLISDNTTPNTDNPFSSIQALIVDELNNRAFVAIWQQILAIDLTTGVREVLSSASMPNASNAISYSQTVSMVLDSENNRLIIADKYSGAIFSINLTTKFRTMLVDSGTEANRGLFNRPSDIALDVLNDRLLILDEDYNSMIAMNLTTKALSPIFNGTSNTKNIIDHQSPVAFDVINDRFIISNYTDVLSIGANSGEGSVFASNGDNYHSYLTAIILDNTKESIISADSDGIAATQLSTGEITHISGRGTPNNNNNFDGLSDLVLDESNNRYLASDSTLSAIFSIDIATGSRTLLSDIITPNTNNPLSKPINLELDKDNNRVLVLDSGLLAVLAVDLTSGVRSTLWDNNFPNAHIDLVTPRSFIYDKASDHLFVIDTSLKALIAIDLATGTSSIISDNVTPNSVNALSTPWEITLDSANNRALVFDLSHKKLFAIDLATGDRTIISDLTSTYSSFKGLVFDIEKNKAFTASSKYLVEINLANGSYTRINYINKVMPYQAKAIEVDAANSRLIVLGNQSITAVDLNDASKSSIYESADFDSFIDMCLNKEVSHAYSIDNRRAVVLKTELANGFTEVLSSPTIPDTLNAFTSLQSIAVDDVNGRALVSGNNKIYAVDLETGARTIFASDTMPNSDNVMQSVGRIIIDKARNRVLAVTSEKEEAVVIFSIDLTTGIRTVFSDESTPNGNTPILDTVNDMTIDTTRNRLILTFDRLEAVMTIDLTDGQRVYIAK